MRTNGTNRRNPARAPGHGCNFRSPQGFGPIDTSGWVSFRRRWPGRDRRKIRNAFWVQPLSKNDPGSVPAWRGVLVSANTLSPLRPIHPAEELAQTACAQGEVEPALESIQVRGGDLVEEVLRQRLLRA